jgi:CHAD domain
VSRDAVLAQLDEARQRFESLDVAHGDYAGALDGFEQGYAQARRRFQRLFAHDEEARDAELVHEWRKSVQVHWRHLSLFSNAWMDVFEARIMAARRLSAVLGSDHDIEIVMATIAGPTGPKLTARQLAALQDCGREQQRVLRAIALGHGRLLFAEDRAAFGQRMSAYWDGAVASSGEAVGSA